MTRKRKWLLAGIAVAGSVILISYVAVPTIARSIIMKKITQDSSNTVGEVTVSWMGPQLLTTLHIEDEFGTVDVDVEIENSILSLITSSSPVTATVRGDALIKATFNSQSEGKPTEPVEPISSETDSSRGENPFSLPSMKLDVKLATLTLDVEEPLVYRDVTCTVDVVPNRHCSMTLTATTDSDGSIEATLQAPNLINDHGGINWDSVATLTFALKDAAIPTFNGIGGWAITEMVGDVSSPNLTQSIAISIRGSLSEYDIPRGSVLIKSQLQTPVKDGSLAFNMDALIGSIDLVDIPTTILIPFLTITDIDVDRDLGPTMNLRVERERSSSPLVAMLQSQELIVSGTIDNANGLITDVDIVANINTELLESISDDQLIGNVKVTLHLDRLIPAGSGENPLLGSVALTGDMQFLPSNVRIQNLHADIAADISDPFISTTGTVTINEQATTFEVMLRSSNKDKIDGLDDLWKNIINQLPNGMGKVNIKNLSTSLMQPYITDDRIDVFRDFGQTLQLDLTLQHDRIASMVTSQRVQARGIVHLSGKDVTGFSDVILNATIGRDLAQQFTGVLFGASASVTANAKQIDVDGNSSFNATVDIGNQHTVIQGNTIRVKNGDSVGNLNANVTASGIDVHLLDAISKLDGLLVDTIGSPLSIDMHVRDLQDEIVVTASGSAPNATFETAFGAFDGRAFTVPNMPTTTALNLSSELTKHLLKNLGPVLSDIRTVKNPILMKVTDASASLQGNLSELNADIRIDIGEVELASGSLTLQLLPLFNTQHNEVIPAFFDPIFIEIRNGIAHYKEFNLTIANKYSIPYSGTVNLVTRELHLKSAVPLTGLGYSIKEIRGLATDIDVPLLITGTIDAPKVDIDPNFDLTKILQSGLLDAIGEAIGGALDGDKKDSIDPFKLLEDILDN